MYLDKSVELLEKEITQLKEQLSKTREEFTMFYEITRLMRSSLHLDELLYIILTSITAHNGLSFNRAALFLYDYEEHKVDGAFAIGPAEPHEAEHVWKKIEEENIDLFELVSRYRNIKRIQATTPIMKVVQSMSYDLSEKAGLLFEVFKRQCSLHVKAHEIALLHEDPLFSRLRFGEAVFVPLWVKNKIIGTIVVDNIITKKSIDDTDKQTLEMFAAQAALAIENSYLYESTLQKAHTDTLTGLWNYGYYRYRYDEMFDESIRFGNSLSVLMIDVDNFKQYNDTYGHVAGDETLMTVAHVLKDQVRKDDVICRYGGEEFVAILPGTDKAEAFSIAERMRLRISQIKGLSREVTVSIGASTYDELSRGTKEMLVQQADSNLYRAKNSGKNKVID